MEIVGDVLNGQPLKKAAGKEFLTDTFNDLTQQKGDGRSRGYKRKEKTFLPVQLTTRD